MKTGKDNHGLLESGDADGALKGLLERLGLPSFLAAAVVVVFVAESLFRLFFLLACLFARSATPPSVSLLRSALSRVVT